MLVKERELLSVLGNISKSSLTLWIAFGSIRTAKSNRPEPYIQPARPVKWLPPVDPATLSLTHEVFDKTTKNRPPPGCRLPDAGSPGAARPGSWEHGRPARWFGHLCGHPWAPDCTALHRTLPHKVHSPPASGPASSTRWIRRGCAPSARLSPRPPPTAHRPPPRPPGQGGASWKRKRRQAQARPSRDLSGPEAAAQGERAMSPELIANIGTGVALAGLNVTATIRLASRVSGVEQRIAKIEGLLEGLGLTARATPPAPPPA